MQIAAHINHVATWSLMFFGVSMVLFGVVRATGAVIAPLICLAVSLLVVRIPLAGMFRVALERRLHLVELSGVLGSRSRARNALLPIRGLARGPHDAPSPDGAARPSRRSDP